MKQTTSKSKSRKGKEEKKNKINKKQERKEEDSTQGEYADLQTRKQRAGGLAPRQTNMIRHQGEQGS